MDLLGVKHIIVCGHYGCGGVTAALHNRQHGLLDNWLRHIQDVRNQHAALLSGIPDEQARVSRLCELNVIEQAVHVCQTTVVQAAWARGQSLAIHGWIYGLADGLLRDLSIVVTRPDELAPVYAAAITRVAT